MTEHPSTGDTVILTKTRTTNPGDTIVPKDIESAVPARTESTPAARKRHLETSSPKAEGVPSKTPRRGEPLPVEEPEVVSSDRPGSSRALRSRTIPTPSVVRNPKKIPSDTTINSNVRKSTTESRIPRKRIHPYDPVARKDPEKSSDSATIERKMLQKSIQHPVAENAAERPLDERPEESETNDSGSLRRSRSTISIGNDSVKLRKTIQWLEEGARRMREDLAATRAELHEERRAARLARREIDAAVREAKTSEATKHLQVISELKTRLARSPTRPTTDSSSSKAELLKDDNHRRELSALRNRLAEAEGTIQKLKAKAQSQKVDGSRRKVEESDARKLEVEVQALRTANKKLEERLQVVTEAERNRAAELRAEHENHESQLSALQKTLRSDTIKMMDEIRSKSREIEKLEKLVLEGSQMHRKQRTKEDDLMRKLRETERTHQIRLAPRIDEKITNNKENRLNDACCHGDCDASVEVEKLREFSLEQQEVIELLRQAVKEKERKLDQLSNKKRKEEFYKQWLELEPVVEVEDEDDHEEGDSALSSAPSSLSPQPGLCGHFQNTGITREAYETVLIEVEELQARLVEEQRELAHAKSQVRELEKALLQETRGSQNSKRALSDKLREAEDREAILVAEVSELREQNELLEFRVLELEETQCLRDTPDPADSGIVSPEPIHLYKEQVAKPRDRAVATVIPYNTYSNTVSPIPRKPPLSLQESGIFDEDEEEEEDEESGIELASRGTQTETPAGDLLQEVQRLHELRARIQERAVKVPLPVIETSRYFGNDAITEANDAPRANNHQDRIRELEERLAAHEEAREKREREKEIAKQREEELLDENYRLTERIHCVENAMKNQKNRPTSLTDERCENRTKESISEMDIESKTNADDSMEDAKEETPTKISVKNIVRKFMENSMENGLENALNVADNSRRDNAKNINKTAEDVDSDGDVPMKDAANSGNVEGALEKSSSMETEDCPVNSNECSLIVEGSGQATTRTCDECSRIEKELRARMTGLMDTVFRAKERISDLERREACYAMSFGKTNETLTDVETKFATQLEEFRSRLDLENATDEKLTTELSKLKMWLKSIDRCAVCEEDLRIKFDTDVQCRWNVRCDGCEKFQKFRNSSQFIHVSGENHRVDAKSEDSRTCSTSIETTDSRGNAVATIKNSSETEDLIDELALEAREDVVDGVQGFQDHDGIVPERIEVRGDEEEIDGVGQINAEPVVTIGDTKVEKKVSDRLTRVSARDEGWAMKVWKSRTSKRAKSLERLKDYFFGQTVCKLVLYDHEFRV